MDGTEDSGDGLEQLARRAAGGDDVALGRLVHAVRPLLLRWALVQTADADDAEDVVQAAQIRMHRALRSFHGESRFTTWLHAVLRTAAADWRRGVRRRTERDARYGRETAHVAQHADSADRARLLDLVRVQLRALPARQREIFDLADLQGRTPAEIARHLGMNLNTVRTHLLRARRTLRSRILEAHAALVEDA